MNKKRKTLLEYCKENDLEYLLEEWDYKKNKDIDISRITYGSNKKVSWICKKGHEWDAKILSRTSASTRSGCPDCNEERKTSFPELYIYYYLKQVFPDTSNRCKIKNLEVDIYIPSLSLGIEYDGYYWHKNKLEKDKEKTILLTKDISLIRIRDEGLDSIKLENCVNYNLQEKFDKHPEKVMFWIFNYIIENYNLSDIQKNCIDAILFNSDEDLVNIYNLIEYIPKDKSLEHMYPELAKEWHPTKNGKLKPIDVFSSSNKKVWWICDKGHEWDSTISNRSVGGNGCPYCFNRKVLKGYNDLATTHPNIAKEWHPTKNADLKPTQVVAGSEKKVWWICDKGHEWDTSPKSRIRGDKCPYCSNKKVLKGYNDLGTTHPDIAKQWHPTKNADLKPTQVTYGSRQNVWWICDKGHEWDMLITSRCTDNQNCPYCSNRKVLKGYNDLATTHPDIAKQWHPIKNGDLKPTQVTYGSQKKVWWICDKGHEWDASPKSRCTRGDRCPYCSNKKVLEGYNDLSTTHPDIAKQWHPTKNGDLKPTQVTYGSNQNVWWICDKGHEWDNLIGYRTIKGRNCPYCSNKRVLKGYNDLATTHPDIAKQWHPTKNGDLKPTQVTCGSNKKVWWICDKGHEYEKKVCQKILYPRCSICKK